MTLTNVQAQICANEESEGLVAGIENIFNFLPLELDEMVFRLKFQVIHNGNIGLIADEGFENILNDLNELYQNAGISFCLEEPVFINGNDIVDGNTVINHVVFNNNDWFEKLLSKEEYFTSNQSNCAINCYVVTHDGFDSWFPGSESGSLAGRGNFLEGYLYGIVNPLSDDSGSTEDIHNIVLAHEIGHCLGLLHQDIEPSTELPQTEPVLGFEYLTCFELVEGDFINRTTCGDKVADTKPHAYNSSLSPLNYSTNFSDNSEEGCGHESCSPQSKIDAQNELGITGPLDIPEQSILDDPNLFAIYQEYLLCYDLDGSPYWNVFNNPMTERRLFDQCTAYMQFTPGQGERTKSLLSSYPRLRSSLIRNTNLDSPIDISFEEDVIISDQNYRLDNMEIADGVNITFNNCNFYFSEDGILDIGVLCNVVFNNCALTSAHTCEEVGSWQGIVHSPEGEGPEYLDSKIFFNYSEVSNAFVGLQISESYTSPECLFQDDGSRINLDHAMFYNNLVDIDIRSVSVNLAPWVESPYLQATESIFLSDGCTQMNFSQYSPVLDTEIIGKWTCIRNNSFQEIVFDGCKFIDNTGLFYSYGIVSNWSALKVIDSNGVGSEFINLRKGIRVYAQVYQPLIIENTHFLGCYRGINLDGVYNAQITNNEILFNTDAEIPELPNEEYFSYGMYLHKCDGYELSGNVFDLQEDLLTPNEYGLIVNNSGHNANLVNGNEFFKLDNGIVALNINNDSELLLSGLKFECNSFQRIFENGILVTETADFGGDEFGIGSAIGSEALSSGNAYHNFGSTLTVNNLGNAVDYYYVLGNENPDPYSGLIIHLNDPESANDCAETEEITIPELQQSVGEFSVLTDSYNQLIDGGNTVSLTHEVLSTSFSDAIEITYELLSKSPYLSDQVIIEAINKETELPNSLLLLLLESNPNALKDPKVKKEIEDKIIPFTEYEKQLLDQAKQLVDAKEQLERQMLEIRAIIQHSIRNEVVHLASSSEFSIEHVNDLSNLSNDDRRIYEMYSLLALSSITDPDQIQNLTERTDFLGLSVGEEMSDLLRISRKWNQDLICSNADLQTLESFTSSNSILGTLAQNLIYAIEGGHYNEPIPSFNVIPRNLNYSISSVKEEFIVYPNPSSALFNIKIPSSLKSSDLEIQLFDAQGRQIPASKIVSFGQSISFQLQSAPGIYQLRINHAITKNILYGSSIVLQ